MNWMQGKLAIVCAYSITNSGVRFRQIPSFGHDTICHFSNDALAMKKLAARNFEDLLQVSAPIWQPGHLPDSPLLVFHSCFWGTLTTPPQWNYHDSTIQAGKVACPCQAMAAHRLHSESTWEHNSNTRSWIAKVSSDHMCSIQYHWATWWEGSMNLQKMLQKPKYRSKCKSGHHKHPTNESKRLESLYL